GVRGLRFLVRRRPTSSPAQREKKAPRTGAAPAAQVLARKMRASRDAVALTPAPERRLAPPCAGYASPAGAAEEITPPRSSAPGSPDRCAIGAAGAHCRGCRGAGRDTAWSRTRRPAVAADRKSTRLNSSHVK